MMNLVQRSIRRPIRRIGTPKRWVVSLLGSLLLLHLLVPASSAPANDRTAERASDDQHDPFRSTRGDPFRRSKGQPFGTSFITPFHIPIPGGIGNQPCIRCHFEGMGTIIPQDELPRKYSIQSAFRTYWDSPHGRLRALGENNAPRCVDCHLTEEWREILPQEHPDSPIHPKNLPKICAKCHGPAMLKARVMDGSMHLDLKRRSLIPGEPVAVRYGFLPGITKLEKSYYIGTIDVVAWVNFLFLVLTVGTLISLTLFMLLDLYRKLMERKSAEHPVALPEDGHETP